jgi:predicted nucleotide-binding protein
MKKNEILKKIHELLAISDTLPKYNEDNNQEYDKWHRKIEDSLEYIPFLEKYFNELEKIKFKDNPMQQGFDKAWGGTAEIDRYNKTIKDTKALLESMIDKINDWNDNIVLDLQKIKHENTTINTINHKPKTKVFIVHGHDELAISQVSDVIRKLKLEPIVLRDQLDRSNTVIEKIEKQTNEVGFGVILYTECDIGGKNINSLQPRARQNVVLEHGYLMARLGRENTMALVKGTIETPSDISGLIYTLMDEHKAWKYKLVDELKASGYKVSKDDI